jgi:hypothetical protein
MVLQRSRLILQLREHGSGNALTITAASAGEACFGVSKLTGECGLRVGAWLATSLLGGPHDHVVFRPRQLK